MITSSVPLRAAVAADCSRRPLWRLAASSSGPKQRSLGQHYTISPVFKVALLIGNTLLPEMEYNLNKYNLNKTLFYFSLDSLICINIAVPSPPPLRARMEHVCSKNKLVSH